MKSFKKILWDINKKVNQDRFDFVEKILQNQENEISNLRKHINYLTRKPLI